MTMTPVNKPINKPKTERTEKGQHGLNDTISNRQYEFRVGLFSVIAIMFVVFGWSWLHSMSIFHPPQRFKVKFHDIAGLNSNATVNINGVRVGNVETIELVRPKDGGEESAAYVLCGLKIRSEAIQIPHHSAFTIQTLGMVGAKYIEITLPKTVTSSDDVIASNEVITGEDPVRVELVINKIATNLSAIDYQAVGHQLTGDMERVAKAADGINDVSHKFSKVADTASGAAEKANGFFDRGRNSWDRIESSSSHFNTLADNWSSTSHKLNKVLDNPALSTDLKTAMASARDASANIQAAMHELNTTIKDPGTKTEIKDILQRLTTATDNIYKSIQVVNKVSGDKELRGDLKSIVQQARDTVSNANEAVNNLSTVLRSNNLEADIHGTAQRVQEAALKTSIVADQMRQVLNKRGFLMQGMFGTPGRLSKKDEESLKKWEDAQTVKQKKPVKDADNRKDKSSSNELPSPTNNAASDKAPNNNDAVSDNAETISKPAAAASGGNE